MSYQDAKLAVQKQIDRNNAQSSDSPNLIQSLAQQTFAGVISEVGKDADYSAEIKDPFSKLIDQATGGAITKAKERLFKKELAKKEKIKTLEYEAGIPLTQRKYTDEVYFKNETENKLAKQKRKDEIDSILDLTQTNLGIRTEDVSNFKEKYINDSTFAGVFKALVQNQGELFFTNQPRKDMDSIHTVETDGEKTYYYTKGNALRAAQRFTDRTHKNLISYLRANGFNNDADKLASKNLSLEERQQFGEKEIVKKFFKENIYGSQESRRIREGHSLLTTAFNDLFTTLDRQLQNSKATIQRDIKTNMGKVQSLDAKIISTLGVSYPKITENLNNITEEDLQSLRDDGRRDAVRFIQQRNAIINRINIDQTTLATVNLPLEQKTFLSKALRKKAFERAVLSGERIDTKQKADDAILEELVRFKSGDKEYADILQTMQLIGKTGIRSAGSSNASPILRKKNQEEEGAAEGEEEVSTDPTKVIVNKATKVQGVSKAKTREDKPENETQPAGK